MVLLLAGLWGPSYLEGIDLRASSETVRVERVNAPAPPEAPEPVVDLAAKKEAEESAAEKEAAAAKKEAEERAAREEDERRAAEEEENEIPAPSDPTTYLTIPKLGLVDNTVYNDASPATLDIGAAKLPETGFPWQDNANSYIAGHRVGYAGTESYNQFYNLPAMVAGDEIFLEDTNGTAYTYEVSDVFAVMPDETYVTNPQPGRDMITLQTCVANLTDWWTITPGLLTSPPGPETARLIVQADRVDVQPAA